VTEAGRLQRASKRPGGKSDPADAARAARDALAADRFAQPRADGMRDALRILLTAGAQHRTDRRRPIPAPTPPADLAVASSHRDGLSFSRLGSIRACAEVPRS